MTRAAEPGADGRGVVRANEDRREPKDEGIRYGVPVIPKDEGIRYGLPVIKRAMSIGDRRRPERFNEEDIQMARKTLHGVRVFCLLLSLFLGLEAAYAGDGIVVALGASNTYGQWVARGEDYPAQLEQLLRAKGFKVSVINAGAGGDTTRGMLARLDGVTPEGTRLVLFQAGSNDQQQGFGAERASNIDLLKRRLASRKIAVIMVDQHFHGKETVDGIHLTAAGYHQVAEELLPEVERALRSK